MKTEIKYTENYILLVDLEAEVCRGQYVYFNGQIELIHEGHHYPYKGNKIIAYKKLNPQAKDLDLPLLPEFGENIEKLSKIASKENISKSITDKKIIWFYEKGFKAGYKASQSKGTFTLEDMEKAIQMARSGDFELMIENGILDFLHIGEEIIQQIQQSKLPKGFEPEFIQKDLYWLPKTKTNSEGKEVVQGKWIY